ncbi:uncharacterized protein LOC129600517 isoform X2 [Paramacrobiotus metropolitanus]|uniref:uncharacterized protein LOC129600517 isoform X2 n=1 Tax=Paramacrobiotus metropolitanus TaxID=2943436 RepID=UPI0024460BA7|nr:uncharacterized protein LOC129600517 isoform X2 [Paramacrobiotus metropolitanus]
MVLCQCLLGEAPDRVSHVDHCDRATERSRNEKNIKQKSPADKLLSQPSIQKPPAAPAPKGPPPITSHYAIYTQPNKIPPRTDHSSVKSAKTTPSFKSTRSSVKAQWNTGSPQPTNTLKHPAPPPPDARSLSSGRSSKSGRSSPAPRRQEAPTKTLGELLVPSSSNHSSAKGKNVYRSNSALQISFAKSNHDLEDFYAQHPGYEADAIESKGFIVPSRSLTQEDYESCLPPSAYPTANAESSRVTVLVERPDSASSHNNQPAQWNSGTFQHVVDTQPIPAPHLDRDEPQPYDSASVKSILSMKSKLSAKSRVSPVSQRSRVSSKSPSPVARSPVYDNEELDDNNPFATEIRRPQSRSSLESNGRKVSDRKSPSKNSLGSVHEHYGHAVHRPVPYY